MKKVFKKQPGITLIELLLYIAIFSLIITTVVTVALSTTAARVRNNAILEVDYQGVSTINTITAAIRSSQSVNSPSLNTAGSSLSLNMAQPGVSPTVFSMVSDGDKNRLQIGEGSPAVNNFLTNNKVSVVSLNITNATILDGKESIQIELTIRYHNPAGRSELDYQKTFYGGGTLR